MALYVPPLTGSIMSAVPLGKAGVGSAMNDTTRELGGALGVAVLGSLVASRYGAEIASAISGLSPRGPRPGATPVRGARVAAQISGQAGAQVADAARHAYVSGMSVATLVGAVVAVVGSFFVYRKLPSSLRRDAPAPASDEARRRDAGELEAAHVEGRSPGRPPAGPQYPRPP